MESPFSVLVVDDDKAIINIFEFGLRDKGYEVHTAETASDARKLASTIHIDCLLSDIHLPDMNGIELTAKLSQQYSDLITILMTGYPGIKTAIQGLRENVQDYLIKPFSVDQVVASIERARQLRRLERNKAENEARIAVLEQENQELKEQLESFSRAQRSVQQGALGARGKLGSGTEMARRSYAQQIKGASALSEIEDSGEKSKTLDGDS
jgi:DNA-binding NtrC family response regulator